MTVYVRLSFGFDAAYVIRHGIAVNVAQGKLQDFRSIVGHGRCGGSQCKHTVFHRQLGLLA